MLKVKKNFIPKNGKKTYDYFCTWQSQADGAQNELGDVRDTRNTLNYEFLFSDDGILKNWFENTRKEIIVVLDDGWDVPYDASNYDFTDFSEFGSFELNEDRFPQFKGEPQERLKQLNHCIKNMGYKGLGVWVYANALGEREGSYLSKTEMYEYWKTRAQWCGYAGIEYWKVDWGMYEHDISFRETLTKIVHKYAPNIKIEHAVPQSAWHFEEENEIEINEYKRTLPISDYFRTYDVLPNVGTAVTLYRIAKCIDACNDVSSGMCILNVEDELEIASALGCAAGIMKHPKWMPDRDKKINALLNWHKIAAPFPLDATFINVSDERLVDTYSFENISENHWIYNIAGGKTAEIRYPAIIARNAELPIITSNGEPPFVVCSINPYSGAYSIGFLKRTVDGKKNQELLCNAEIKLNDMNKPIGVFGKFSEIRVRFDKDTQISKLYMQRLDTEETFDISECVDTDKSGFTIGSDGLFKRGLSTENGILIQAEN